MTLSRHLSPALAWPSPKRGWPGKTPIGITLQRSYYGTAKTLGKGKKGRLRCMKQAQKAAQRITGDDYVAYLRVSSKGQVNTDYNPEGVSIPAQREKVEERGRELGSTKAAEFIDPGRSART